MVRMSTTVNETPKALFFSQSSSMKSSMTESNVLLDRVAAKILPRFCKASIIEGEGHFILIL